MLLELLQRRVVPREAVEQVLVTEGVVPQHVREVARLQQLVA